MINQQTQGTASPARLMAEELAASSPTPSHHPVFPQLRVTTPNMLPFKSSHNSNSNTPIHDPRRNFSNSAQPDEYHLSIFQEGFGSIMQGSTINKTTQNVSSGHALEAGRRATGENSR